MTAHIHSESFDVGVDFGAVLLQATAGEYGLQHQYGSVVFYGGFRSPAPVCWVFFTGANDVSCSLLPSSCVSPIFLFFVCCLGVFVCFILENANTKEGQRKDEMNILHLKLGSRCDVGTWSVHGPLIPSTIDAGGTYTQAAVQCCA